MGLQGVQLDLTALSAMGVKRISVGSALTRAAFGAFLGAAREMKEAWSVRVRERGRGLPGPQRDVRPGEARALPLVSLVNEVMFRGQGGLELFGRSWHPEGTPRGAVLIVHGFKLRSGLYEWVAERLVEHGLAVYAYDLRGHGRSGGRRYDVDSFAQYVGDTHEVVEAVRAREPGLRVVILGHSAGGVIASVYALEHQENLAGLESESFAYELPARAVALTLFKNMGRFAPKLGILGLRDAWFSRDPSFVERMKRDPWVIHDRAPSRTVGEMIRADERLRREFPDIILPVLILHGTADRLDEPARERALLRGGRIGGQDVKLYDGYFHDLLNDVGKERVMADIGAWIDPRIKA